MSMHMRRFTGLTNDFSNKVKNHMHAVALHFMYYYFAKVHQSLKVTPAVAAGLTDHLRDIADLAAIVNANEPAPQETRAVQNASAGKIKMAH